MMGSAAFSPFRLDALRAAMAAADSAFAGAKIDARWVYAIEPEGKGPDAETLARAALLLNADGVVRDSSFAVREPRATSHEPRTTPST